MPDPAGRSRQCHHLSRRSFLGKLAAAGGALAASRILPARATTPMPNISLVSIVPGLDLKQMTLQCIEQLGGLDFVQGKKILIKPNLVTEQHKRYGEITHPEIIATVAEQCVIKGASRVYIGEYQDNGYTSAGDPSLSGVQYLTPVDAPFGFSCTDSGVYQPQEKPDAVGGIWFEKIRATWTSEGGAVKSMRDWYEASPYKDSIEMKCFTAYGIRYSKIPNPMIKNLRYTGGSAQGKIAFTQLVDDCDYIISLPALKCHHECGVTLSIKNLFGLTPCRGPYWRPSDAGGDNNNLSDWSRLGAGRYIGHNHGIHHFVTDVFKYVQHKVRLAIVDGSIGIQGYGTLMWETGLPVSVKDKLGQYLVIGSTDALAADATAARIIGYDPLRIPYLHFCWRQGLGSLLPREIRVRGPHLGDIQMDFQPAPEYQLYTRYKGISQTTSWKDCPGVE